MRVEAVNRRWMMRFLSREMRMKKLGGMEVRDGVDEVEDGVERQRTN